MQRKDALITMATLVSLAASSTVLAAETGLAKGGTVAAALKAGKKLRPPARGPVNVGFVIGPELVQIDVFGPWVAFSDAFVGMKMDMNKPLFNNYAIAATTEPLDVDGGMNIQARYSFENAPQPHVLVIPAQKSLPATLAYVKAASMHADVTMSVCTGAFLAAAAGLFDGLKATTHHSAYDEFEKSFPKVTLVRGPKYVENRDVSASGGESSGIDLALRVVERYYGAEGAKNAAYNMEYRRTRRPQSINEV